MPVMTREKHQDEIALDSALGSEPDEPLHLLLDEILVLLADCLPEYIGFGEGNACWNHAQAVNLWR